MKRKRAFTLIELIICVAIVAIISAIAIPKLKKARERADAEQARLEDPYYEEKKLNKKLEETYVLYSAWMKLHPDSNLTHEEWLALKENGMLK